MKIINKLEILAIFTLISLTLGNQPVLSRNNPSNDLENLKHQETKTLLVSSQTLVDVNDPSIILPIPQPLGILSILGMVGVSSFLKLKITKVKYKKQSEKKIQEPKPSFSPHPTQGTEIL